jgi:hypothetical protein
VIVAANPKHPPGSPMTLGNMRELGVHHFIAYCLNNACRHTALIDVSRYPAETGVPWLGRQAKCSNCGGKRADVLPNRKELPAMPDKWGPVRLGMTDGPLARRFHRQGAAHAALAEAATRTLTT